MAELVHLRLEETLPELEEMERVGLFSAEEIRKIVKKREMLEYRLRRDLRTKEDFMNYINYEYALLMLISKRRKRLLCESKKKEIDYKIASRIKHLYESAANSFPNDIDIRQKNVAFCKRMKWFNSIATIYGQMLKDHPKNTSAWLNAARWELKGNTSPENARKLFQRGVLINPKSKELWLHYFHMELYYIQLIRRRREALQLQKMKEHDADENDVVLSGKIPLVIFDNAIEEIDDDVNFTSAFLQKCLEFDFTNKLVDYILQRITEMFPDEEEALDILAKQPLINIEEKIKIGKEQGIKKKQTVQRIYEEIFLKYEDAVNKVSTEKMWSMYIDFLSNLYRTSKENMKKKFQNKLIDLMKRASSVNCLSVECYPEWIDLLVENGDENEALSISLETARKSQKLDVWYKTLTHHIQCMLPSKLIYQLLQEAINSVPEKDSLTLWRLGIDWLSISDPEKLEEFFEIGMKRSKIISMPLKEMYLEFTALKSSLEACRELYKRFKKKGSISYDVTKKIIDLEKGQLNPPIDILRKYYEEGILKFGSTNIDIWLDYMKMELEHEKGNSAASGTLIWKAKKTLQAEYMEDFNNRLTELFS